MDLHRPPHTLVLPIDCRVWPTPEHPIEVDGTVYAPKQELHITLIGSRLGRELHAALAPEFLAKRIARAMAAQDWQFRRTGRFIVLGIRPPPLTMAGHDRAHPDPDPESDPAPDSDLNPAPAAGPVPVVAPRQSIIELIQLPAMRPFHQALGRLLGRQLPLPPAHVTLYTAHGPRGIGLASASQLRSRRIRALPAEVLQDAEQHLMAPA
ncbi:hypothetical protein INQ40_00280 [Lysobacter sp. H21R4]|uniref:hypothetical protein n=1 Tax=Lysobacter sp. H21R4 TaxID=2781021 RepID=UPI00188817C0|nr:hypothetical protein [Lysobacter sp. H21R4]QOY62803.1 hypothetical protein INQ40_00280 [Lysobacter sp. H21R4]